MQRASEIPTAEKLPLAEKLPPTEKFALKSVADLLALPAPDWLVDGLVESGAFVVLYGPSSTGKTFVALDLALCIATGKSWHGRPVTKASVVYVVAEGTLGIPRRLSAWMKHHEVTEIPGAFFILEAPQLHKLDGPNVAAQIKARLPTGPIFVVFDTFAQCFVGGDENKAQEVGAWVDACRQLRSDLGAAVMVVHHTGKTGETERGSSALRAAADSMIRVRRDKSILTVENDKQKDDEEAPPIRLQQLIVPPSDSEKRGSCVLVEATADASTSQSSGLTATDLSLLAALSQHPDGAQTSQWKDTSKSEIASRTFSRHIKKLFEGKFIEAIAGLTPPRYRLTDTGQQSIGAPIAIANEANLAPAMPPPPGGGQPAEGAADAEASAALSELVEVGL